MKILLVMSPMFYHDTHYITSADTEVPIGLCYLGAVLEKAGHFVKILDGQITINIKKELADLLADKEYKAVGFSITAPSSSNAKRLVSLAREIRPDIKIIAGGAHVTVIGIEIFKEMPEIDFAVFGEAENTILEIAQYLEGTRKKRGSIDGIAFKKGERIIKTKSRDLIKNLDELPHPAYHLVDILKYTPPPGLFFRKPTIAIASARGCPFNCAYCADTILWRGRCRMHSARYVVNEMEYLVNKYGIKEIRFFDDTFTINRLRVMEICNMLLERNLNVLWRCASRADMVDEELLKLMKKAGCCSISYGIESGDEGILEKMNRKMTITTIRNAVKWSQKAGIETKGFFMLNYPGETKETTEKTIALSRELDFDFVGFNLTVPFRGTKVREDIMLNYKVEPKYWDNWDRPVGNQIYFYQDQLPVEYLKKAYNRALKGFHLRPRWILRSLRKLRSWEIIKSYFKGFLRLFKIKVLD